jgi:hypothetical protein
MPDLEELALPHDHYHLSTDYCQQVETAYGLGIVTETRSWRRLPTLCICCIDRGSS